MKTKLSRLIVLTLALVAAPLLAQNLLTNGDLSYGDGGWYLWNNPAGPAEVQTKIGEMGLGRLPVSL